MRVFKHGDSLAVVIPPSIKASSKIAENDEFEFFELEPGIIILASKAKLSFTVGEKVTSTLVRKAMESTFQQETAPAPARQNSNYSQPAPSFVTAAELAKSTPVANKSIDAILGGNGYAILDEASAKVASKELESYLSHGEVYGAKGFDNKFYVISREQFEPLAEKIVARISRGTEIVPELAAQALKEDPVKVACTLHVLKERGDALEKKRGIFMLLD